MHIRNIAWLLLAVAVMWPAPFASAQRVLQVGVATLEQVEYYQTVLAPEFERRHPGVKVEVYNIFWGPDPYIVRYIAGNPPDVFQTGGDKLGAYLDMIVPLDPFIEATSWQENLSDFPAPILDSLRVDGQLMGLPWNYAVRQFTYRKDWFAEAGLDPERPPTTWAELVEFGRRLTTFDSDGNMTRQGFNTREHYIEFHPFLIQAGGSWMNEGLTMVTFADERGMEAIEFMYELYHVHRISDPNTRRGGLGGIASGGAAMEYTTQAPFASNDGTYFDSDVIGVGPPLAHRVQSQIVLPSTWHITDISPHKDLAWEWIRFMLEVEIVVQNAREGGFIPVRISVGASYSPWTDDPRWAQTFQNLSMSSTVPQASPYFNDLRRWQMDGLARVLFDGENPRIMEMQQELANAWLKEQLAK